MAHNYYVYRLYASDGALLYVGMSKSPNARLKRHKRDKDWAADISSMNYKGYDSRDSARAAEIDAIRTEGPRYNVQDRDRRGDARIRRAAIFTEVEESADLREEAALILDRFIGQGPTMWQTSEDRSIRGALMSVAQSLRDGGTIQQGLDDWYGPIRSGGAA